MRAEICAFRFTVLRLFAAWQQDFFEVGIASRPTDMRPPPDKPQSCFLHTLTFADPEPSHEEAKHRLHVLRKWMLRKGLKAVWAVERGSEKGRIHFHLVSAVEFGPLFYVELSKRGFGRYDVRKRPFSRCMYLAKYLWKTRGGSIEHEPVRFRLPKGTRRWGVIGIAPCKPSVVKIRIVQKELASVAPEPQPYRIPEVWECEYSGTKITLRRPSFVRSPPWTLGSTYAQ